MLNVKKLSAYIPVERVSIDDLSGRLALDASAVQVFRRLYGLEHVSKSNLSFATLLETTIRDLLESSNTDPAEIGLIIYTHTAQEIAPFPNTVLAQVQRRVGLVNARAFALHSNNCASLLSALDVAHIYVSSALEKTNVIIISADLTFSEILLHIPDTTVCGDAAAACLIGPHDTESGTRMLSLKMNTFGAHAKGTWQEREEAAVFEGQYADRLASVMQESLIATGLDWSDIKWIFPHNINRLSWRKVNGITGVSAEKLFMKQMGQLGHCFGSDVLINWLTAFDEGELKDGDYFMLATVGLGAVFAAAVFQYGAVTS